MLQPGPSSVGEEKGRLRMMKLSSSVPSNWHASRQSTSHNSGLISPEYLVMVVGARNRVGNSARRMAWLKTRGPGGSGEGLRSSSLL
jgi:hypothetical protein